MLSRTSDSLPDTFVSLMIKNRQNEKKKNRQNELYIFAQIGLVQSGDTTKYHRLGGL